jgi:PAS domain S-box-containing protein
VLRVLYVDDEELLLELGQAFLENNGEFSVDTVSSARLALKKIATTTYDAIISDFQMPDMDGIEFLTAVRADHKKIPFILFTGRGREEVVIAAINNGADFYLQKGGDANAQFAELAHKIRQAVSRRRSEAALADSERRLSDIIDFLPDATFAIDTRGNVIAWNRAMEEMTGTKAADILGKGDHEYGMAFYGNRRPMLIDLVNDQEPVFEQQHYTFTRHSGSTITAETTIRKNGRDVYYWGKASILFNKDGERTGAIESVRDITERKASERALADSEEKFHTLFLNNPSLEVVTDIGTGIIIDVNDEFLRVTGYAREEVVGSNAQSLNLLADDRDRALFFDLIKKKEPVRHLKTRIKTRSGTERVLDLFAQVISAGGRDLLFTQGIDITEQERSADDARAAYEQLAAADEELRAQLDELRYSQDTIRHKEHFLRSIFSSIQEGISILDDTMTVIDVNRTMEEWYRHEMPLVGRKCYEVYHGRTQRCDTCPSATTLRTGKPAIETVPLVDGGVVKGWLELYSYPFIDTDTGRMIGVIEYVHNISERRQKEEELRAAYEQLTAAEEELRAQYDALSENQAGLAASEARYRGILDTIQDVYYRTDTRGTLIMISPSGARLLGYDTMDEMIGRPATAFYEDPDKRDDLMQAIRTQGSVDSLEVTLKHKNGSPVLVSTNSHFWYDINGSPGGIEGTFRDITKLHKSEQQVKTLANALEISPVAVLIHDPDGNFLYANQKTFELHGYNRDEFMALTLRQINSGPSIERISERMAQIRHDGEASFVVEHLHKDGSKIPLRVSARAVRWNDRDVILSSSLDLRKLQRSEEALRIANHKLGLLSAVTRHDVINQLMALRGFVSLLKNYSTDPKFLNLIQKQESIIARIEREIQFTREYQDIGVRSPVWQNAGESIRAGIRDIHLAGTVIDTADLHTLEIFADPLLAKVFFNLVDNALRYGGSSLKKVRFSKRAAGENLILTCEDDGAGIPLEEKHRIFERGYGKNTGLGLFLIREILAITGLSIEENGTPGTGARFEITLPKGTFRNAGTG